MTSRVVTRLLEEQALGLHGAETGSGRWEVTAAGMAVSLALATMEYSKVQLFTCEQNKK